MFNYSKLKGRIKEVCQTQETFSKKLGMSEATLSARLNNKTEFTQSEIMNSQMILKFDKMESPLYFFTE